MGEWWISLGWIPEMDSLQLVDWICSTREREVVIRMGGQCVSHKDTKGETICDGHITHLL